MSISPKEYLEAVDIVCGECYGTEETCKTCPVRICCDNKIKSVEQPKTEKPRKQIVPCDIAIKRFYRMYVEVDEGASAARIEALAKRMIVESNNPDSELCPDPDIFSEIEEQDICWVNPDWDGAHYKDDDEEVEL